MNNNPQDLIDELQEENVILVVDNDMCYTRYEDDEDKGDSYNFGPTELVHILCEMHAIDSEAV